jgi:dienelactone hydrolase
MNSLLESYENHQGKQCFESLAQPLSCVGADLDHSFPTKRQRKFNANLSLRIPEVEYKVVPVSQHNFASKESQKTKLTCQLTEATGLGEHTDIARFDSRYSPLLQSSSHRDSKKSRNVSFNDALAHQEG